MKIGFILTAYERIDDLLAHLDILKFFPIPHEVIPIWMKKDSPGWFVEEMGKWEHAHYCDGVSFRIGPLLALVSGLRKAKEIGLDYVVYRNGDDWLFNHDFCLENFKVMAAGKSVAAYNWLTVGTLTEFALNEMYLRVDKFVNTSYEAEEYFRKSSHKFLCELKMCRWIRRSIESFDEFYRLPGREQEPGIGYETETLSQIFEMHNKTPIPGLEKLLQVNNRFFNERWQLIGSHNNLHRRNYYNAIRSNVPYHPELEREKHFSRWLSGSVWNLPLSEQAKKDRVPWTWIQPKKTLIIKSLPKKVPLKLFKR